MANIGEICQKIYPNPDRRPYFQGTFHGLKIARIRMAGEFSRQENIPHTFHFSDWFNRDPYNGLL